MRRTLQYITWLILCTTFLTSCGKSSPTKDSNQPDSLIVENQFVDSVYKALPKSCFGYGDRMRWWDVYVNFTHDYSMINKSPELTMPDSSFIIDLPAEKDVRMKVSKYPGYLVLECTKFFSEEFIKRNHHNFDRIEIITFYVDTVNAYAISYCKNHEAIYTEVGKCHNDSVIKNANLWMNHPIKLTDHLYDFILFATYPTHFTERDIQTVSIADNTFPLIGMPEFMPRLIHRKWTLTELRKFPSIFNSDL